MKIFQLIPTEQKQIYFLSKESSPALDSSKLYICTLIKVLYIPSL